MKFKRLPRSLLIPRQKFYLIHHASMYAVKSLNYFGCIILRISKNVRFYSNSSFKIQDTGKSLPRFDDKSQIPNDVVLFTSKNSKYFLGLNTLSMLNCIFWSYIGYFMCSHLKEYELQYSSSFWNWVQDLEKKHSSKLAALCFLFGLTGAPATLFYTARSIKQLILQKGGKNLIIITYKVPGFNNKSIVPLKYVSACSSRKTAKTSLSLKVKNKWFYYIIDLKGNFKNPSLFDFTAGVERNF